MTNRNKAILSIILSSIGFAFMAVFIRLSGDLPSIQKAMFRNIITGVISLIFLLRMRVDFVGVSHKRILFLRGFVGTLGLVLNFYAIDNLILADANLIFKLSTFFLLIFCFMFLKEKIKSFQVVAIIVAFIGTIFVVNPAFDFLLIPYLAAIFGSMFAGLAYTLVRLLGKNQHFMVIVFYFSFTSTLILFPFAIFFYQPMTSIQLLYLVLAGCCATVGQFGVTLGYKLAAPGEVSIFNYLSVIFSAILGFTFFNESIHYISILGYILIFSSSYYLFLKNKKIVYEGNDSLIRE